MKKRRKSFYHKTKNRIRLWALVIVLWLLLGLLVVTFALVRQCSVLPQPSSSPLGYNNDPSEITSVSSLPSGSVTSFTSVTVSPSSSVTITPSPSLSTSVEEKTVLNVPFLVQAPFGNWDARHEDACEEASLIMVEHFRAGTPLTSDASADNEIKAMIAYEGAHGYGLSITVEQLGGLATIYYGDRMTNFRTETFTEEKVEAEINAGKPVIIPAAGQVLDNPYFSNGGPLYHMLVIKGYDATGYITNDPGTKRGDGSHYTYDNLYDAVHDWNNGDILNGQKVYLVFD